MRVGIQLLMVALVCSALARTAAADSPVPIEHKWCVRADGIPGSWGGCQGPAACSGTFTSIASALAAAAIAPDPDPTDPSAHLVCIDSASGHSESVTVDNSTGAYGDYLGLEFAGTSGVSWCDDDDPGRTAGIVFIGDASPEPLLEVHRLRTDDSVCSRTRPLVEVQNSRSGVLRSVVVGGTAPVLSTTSQLDPELHVGGLYLSTVEGVNASVVDAGTTIELWDSGIFSSQSNGAPLIAMSASSSPGGSNDTFLDIRGSTIAANATSGAPLLLSSEGLLIRQSTLHGNVVLEGPLLQVGPSNPTIRAKHFIREVEFSENRLLSSGTSATTPEPSRLLVDPPSLPGSECGSPGDQGLALQDRGVVLATAQASSLALIQFDSPGLSDESYRIYRSYFAGNEIGVDGALIDLGNGHLDSSLYLIHNAFGVHDGVTLRGGEGPGPCRLASIRNLYLSQPAVAPGSCWTRVEALLDVVPDPTGWASVLTTIAPDIVGPFVQAELGPSDFLDREAMLGSSDCDRFLTHCPDVGLGCAGGVSWCPSGAGADLLLQEQNYAVLAQQYPFASTLFSSPNPGPAWDVPGPPGWGCGSDSWPRDDADKSDADGFTDLVDCNNSDGSVVPMVPEYDGITVPWCQPDSNTCYVCPLGSCWPPGDGDCPPLPGDDDDSGAGDDDDSGGADDDDAMGDDDDAQGDTTNPPALSVAPGCRSGNGCGTPIGLTWLVLVLLTPLLRYRTF